VRRSALLAPSAEQVVDGDLAVRERQRAQALAAPGGADEAIAIGCGLAVDEHHWYRGVAARGAWPSNGRYNLRILAQHTVRRRGRAEDRYLSGNTTQSLNHQAAYSYCQNHFR
jgi:hypothetical protein